MIIIHTSEHILYIYCMLKKWVPKLLTFFKYLMTVFICTY